jgi:hypothetical protein
VQIKLVIFILFRCTSAGMFFASRRREQRSLHYDQVAVTQDERRRGPRPGIAIKYLSRTSAHRAAPRAMALAPRPFTCAAPRASAWAPRSSTSNAQRAPLRETDCAPRPITADAQ